MKKWKEYMMLAVLCISMVGCGKKDSGSELLTEVQETVTPVEEVVKAGRRGDTRGHQAPCIQWR